MEILKTSRKQHRRLFTKACNDFHKEESELDIDEKITKLRLIEEKAKHLLVIEEQFRQMLFESDESEDTIEKDIDESEAYVDKWRILELKLNKLKCVENETSVSSDNFPRPTAPDLMHYPRIRLPTFDGNVRNWLNFWGQFQKIDKDSSLDDHDKFAFLSQSMEKGSPAEELIKSFPPGGLSYDKAVKQLKARFGKEDLLIEIYVRDLLALVLQKHNAYKNNSLRKLYDKLESKLRALETLGVVRDKYATMLLPLVESALPDETLRAWERYRSAHRRSRDESEDEQEIIARHTTDLDHILRFLQDEVEGEERVTLVTQSFENVKVARSTGKQNINGAMPKRMPMAPSATDLLTSSHNGKNCIFCNNTHRPWDCNNARKLSLQERQTAIEKAHCCFLCLRTGHGVQKCRAKSYCLLCGKKHHTLLCRNISSSEACRSNDAIEEDSRAPDSQKVESLANISRSPTVLLQTLAVTLKGRGKERTVRAIIDTASQRSYILKDTALEMKYESLGKECLRHSLFGGTNTSACEHSIYKIYLSNESGTYNCRLSVLSQSVICETVSPVARGPWLTELSNCGVHLTDDRDGPIEVLLGADVAGKLFTGICKRMSSGLTAIETKLGWTVMGRTDDNSLSNNTELIVTSMLSKSVCVEDLWILDTLGITDPSEKKTILELQEAAKEHFLNTVRVENERFSVHLPWLEGHPPIADNFEISLKRLNVVTKRLRNEGLYESYGKVFESWLEDNIIEEVPKVELQLPAHYLPHRPVIKENSTTKIRPVFDASAKQKGSYSLNDCLEKGVNLIELIPNILYRFRTRKIGVIADIKKAFLQISLSPSDRDFLRFLWDGKDGELKHYRHCRVVFGVSSSPFLLGMAIQYHLQTVLKRHHNDYPEDMVKLLMNSFYVDNCVTSVPNEQDLALFIKVSTTIMAERKMELRGWESNGLVLDVIPEANVLGLLWDKGTDTLRINTASIKELCVEKINKKVILSAAHRIFDPVGMACPVVLFPKLLLQRTWKLKLNWDEEVDVKTKAEFQKWWNEVISHLDRVSIPRYFGNNGYKEGCSLHFFCDASKYAYATAAFIRIERDETVKVWLLQARSRVSPTGKKDTTIARLELLAATISSRLASTMMPEIPHEEVYFWTDSTTVLTWITREESWGTFVHNRVTEIRDLTPKERWRHVPGLMNPADLPSRGCSASHLFKSKWWEGPSWLHNRKRDWPTSNFAVNEEEVACEKKKRVVSSLITMGSTLISARFSDYKKILRVIAWINRFLHNCRNKQKRVKEINTVELNEAEKLIVRLIQIESFEGINDKRLASLDTFYDDGIIRIKTGVYRRDDDAEFKTPAVLPGEHPIVKTLVLKEHIEKGHVGVSYVLNSLRERFWLLCGRRNVRSVLGRCVICKRHTAKNVNPPTAPPPADRVRDAAVFQVTGVDFAGPLLLRDRRKAWICLFTCAVYRAVHIELVTSLSTEAFLLALHRFVARRGKPSTIYSDNGSNFTGTANAFELIDFDVISHKAVEERITWKFIPPGAPWWGGWWERLVGMMKQILRKVLGRASLSYEEMLTVLCNCEAILNNRPLTAVTADTDFTALTPADFLRDIKSDRIPDICVAADSNKLRQRLRYIEDVREAFRKRFRKEYLGVLQTKRKNSTVNSIKPGDLVLVGGTDKKRIAWPLGRVLELIPGNDGISRCARIKTQNGILLRALQTLYTLEISAVENLPAASQGIKTCKTKKPQGV